LKEVREWSTVKLQFEPVLARAKLGATGKGEDIKTDICVVFYVKTVKEGNTT
jgi:hypothetical protein